MHWCCWPENSSFKMYPRNFEFGYSSWWIIPKQELDIRLSISTNKLNDFNADQIDTLHKTSLLTEPCFLVKTNWTTLVFVFASIISLHWIYKEIKCLKVKWEKRRGTVATSQEVYLQPGIGSSQLICCKTTVLILQWYRKSAC